MPARYSAPPASPRAMCPLHTGATGVRHPARQMDGPERGLLQRRGLRHGVALGTLVLALSLAGGNGALAQETGQATVQDTAQDTAAGTTVVGVPDATGPVMLIADNVYLDSSGRLVAEGNVEALQGGVRLNAARIVYDDSTGSLDVEGPIVLTLADANEEQNLDPTTIVADEAQIDAELRNGLIQGARMMLGEQVQMASEQLSRIEGRYTQLYKSTVSSCHVCDDGKPPLWQIRAKKVIHDEVERQIYFESAWMDIWGVPVFYLPRLRLPDPSVDRSTGFLIPSIRRNSQLGTGVKVPYFIAMGDHKDLTLTPYVSPDTTTLEFRYRQAFSMGALAITGAGSSDDLDDSDLRGFLNAAGKFYLPSDFVLEFHIEAVSDDSYLSDYGYSDDDRIESILRIGRARRDQWIGGQITHYQSLRTGEDNATIPSIIGDASFEQRLFPAYIGGELRLGTEVHGHYRYSDEATDANGDGDADGRDVARFTVSANWLRQWTLAYGIRAEVVGGFAFDTFRTWNDASLPPRQSGFTPATGVTLRWPWQKASASGTFQVIEPLLQVAWSGGDPLDVANDESTLIDFDEGNLLAMSYFTAPDRRQRGLRGAYGLAYSRYQPNGWTGHFVLGQVIQQEVEEDFTLSSGLSTSSSDLLLAAQVQAPGGWSITARGLFDTAYDVNKAEARAAWVNERAQFAASYVWLGADEAEDRPNVISEWKLAGAYRLTDNWSTSGSVQYDIVADQATKAGLSITYTNECVDMTLAASRTYTSSSVVTPSTDFSFTVGLRGFSAETAGGTARTCRN